MRSALLSCLLFSAIVLVARADGPADNVADKVRRIPPLPKDPVSAADKAELQKGADELGAEIDSLRTALKGKPALLDLLPDVQIYHNAVRYALTYDEIFDAKKEVPIARKLLQLGLERAKALKEGKAPWTTQTGLVVRGYVSKIDGSVQPYGLVVPASYQPSAPHKHRLDLWCHGRGETLSELNFLNGRQTNPGEFTPPDAFVLHPYGRYCNANKFAGEIDTLRGARPRQEALPRSTRTGSSLRGFSMGGAACWQFAVHYPTLWAAAAPGAGFTETPEFLNVFQNEKVKPTWYEKKLWHLYDCTDYAANLFNLPTVAYSGEIDRQKQAADVMARRAEEGGPGARPTSSARRPGTATTRRRRRRSTGGSTRSSRRAATAVPPQVQFTTYTLRYNRCVWVTVDGLEKHWERARVDAEIVGDGTVERQDRERHGADARHAAGPVPARPGEHAGRRRSTASELTAAAAELGPLVDGALPQGRRAVGSRRRRTPTTDLAQAPRPARPDRRRLHGPLPHRPADRQAAEREGRARGPTREMKHAVDALAAAVPRRRPGQGRHGRHRRRHRDEQPRPVGRPVEQRGAGEDRRQAADEVDDGRRSSSATRRSPAGTHVPVLIYPNPLNPKKYVVLNSGFTFREYDYLNNARQVPKLPDYAVIDATTPETSRSPGKVVAAGFFDEKWQLP